MNETSRQRHGGGCIIRLIIFAVIIFAVWWFNNFWLITTNETIRSDKIKKSIRIAVIGDLHASKSFFAIKNKDIIKKINESSPDAVCFVGDMHSSNADDEEKQISLELMRDTAKEGYRCYFVLGEHDDRTDMYVKKIEQNGINVLDQESEKVNIKGNDIVFYGISNAWFSENFDLRKDFKLDKKAYSILLAHIPMYDDYEKFGADLTICADTHGGIVRIPFMGPAYLDGKILPKVIGDNKEKVYDKGLFKTDSGYIFITSGIGNYPIPARFNNFPEIGVIDIKTGN